MGVGSCADVRSFYPLLYDQYDPFSQCSQPAAVLQLPGRVHASVGRASFVHAMQSRNVVLLHAKVTVQ